MHAWSLLRSDHPGTGVRSLKDTVWLLGTKPESSRLLHYLPALLLAKLLAQNVGPTKAKNTKQKKKKPGTFKATRTQEIDYALLSEKVGGPEKGLL